MTKIGLLATAAPKMRQRQPTRASTSAYAAFISYSHAVDGKLAPALQNGLHRFARPFFALRALRVFRDDASLSVNHGLWSSIEQALSDSEFFILLASPEAAHSRWVRREVDYWMQHKPLATFLIVLTGGELVWNEVVGDFDWGRTTALPSSLRSVFREEPRHIDLRWARVEGDVSLHNPRFRNAVADLSAPLHHKSKDELVGEDVRQHRRTVRWARAAAAALAILLILALFATGIAVDRQQAAEEGRRLAIARLLTTQAQQTVRDDPRTALQLGEAAYSIHPSPETRAGLIYTMTNISRFRESIDLNTNPTSAAAFTPDGRVLAAASTDGTVALWSLSDPAHPHRLGEIRTAHTNGVDQLALAPSGRLMITVSNREPETFMTLWDISDPAQPTVLTQESPGTNGGIGAVTFAPDESILAAATDLGPTILWSLKDPAHPARLSETTETGGYDAGAGRPYDLTGAALAFSPDGRLLAITADSTLESGYVDDPNDPFYGSTLLWDVSDPAHPTHIGDAPTDRTAPVGAVAFAPDGRTLATGTEDGATFLWDLSTPTSPRQLGDPLAGQIDAVITAAFSPDGHTLATGSDSGTAVLWDLSEPAGPTRVDDLTGHADPLIAVVFAPDSRILVTASRDRTAILWNLDNPTRPHTVGAGIPGYPGLDVNVAFAADGRTLAIANFEAGVSLWDLTDPTGPRRLGDPIAAPLYDAWTMAVASDRSTVARAGGADGAGIATLWDLSDPFHPTRFIDQDGQQSIGALAFAPDGRTLVTGSKDGTVILWDLTDPAHPVSRTDPFSPHNGNEVTEVAFAPDGRTLSTSAKDGTTRLWDLSDPLRPTPRGEPLTGPALTPADFAPDGRTLAFAPDGRTLATTSNDRTAILWDLTNPTHPRLGSPLTGHTDSVTAVAFAPDGRTLATASNDRTVILWDLTDRSQPLRLGERLRGHIDPVIAVAFTSDGGTLTTISNMGTAIMWDIKALNDIQTEPVARACAMTKHGLDPPAWARYVPDLPHLDSCPR